MNLSQITVLQLIKHSRVFLTQGLVLSALVWVHFQKLRHVQLKAEGAQSKVKTLQAAGSGQGKGCGFGLAAPMAQTPWLGCANPSASLPHPTTVPPALLQSGLNVPSPEQNMLFLTAGPLHVPFPELGTLCRPILSACLPFVPWVSA